MPKKKKEPEANEPQGKFEIFIGFIKKFEYSNAEEVLDQMQGHPTPGRCYRIIKDQGGYRLHIGRENNKVGLDGLFLGARLKARKADYSFDIELVTPQNYLDLSIHKDDTQKIAEWIETNNKDLVDQLNRETQGQEEILKKLNEIISFKTIKPDTVAEIPDGQTVSFSAKREADGSVNPESLSAAHILSHSLNTISEKDPNMFHAILRAIEYIASTYNDKYESPEMPNIGKVIVTQSATLGKGANVFNMIKYAQRYGTTGYEKSNNVKDIFKVIHYALFEVQRRKYNEPNE